QSKSNVYELNGTLKSSSQPISRRIQMTSDTTLGKLHPILQVVIGWYDSHLHQFIIHGRYYGVPARELGIPFGPDVKSEKNVKLSQIVAGEKTKFVYEYDFGDSWYHDIIVEKILPLEEGV